MKMKLILGLLLGVLLAGCQTAPVDNTSKVNKEPTPKENTAPANNATTEPEPAPEVDSNVVGGQDSKEVIFVLGVDGMD